MSDAIQAYYVEIRALEDEWYAQCQGECGIGASPWTDNLEKLREIDARHGIAQNDPRVYSIAAYQAEAREMDEEWDKQQRENGWGRDDLMTKKESESWFRAEVRKAARDADSKARHFPGLSYGNLATVDTIPKLWAEITIHRLQDPYQTYDRVRYPGKPDDLLKNVHDLYGVMHQLKIPWVRRPPYLKFTDLEAMDELRDIANQLEREEAERLSQLTPAHAPLPDAPTATPPNQSKGESDETARGGGLPVDGPEGLKDFKLGGWLIAGLTPLERALLTCLWCNGKYGERNGRVSFQEAEKALYPQPSGGQELRKGRLERHQKALNRKLCRDSEGNIGIKTGTAGKPQKITYCWLEVGQPNQGTKPGRK